MPYLACALKDVANPENIVFDANVTGWTSGVLTNESRLTIGAIAAGSQGLLPCMPHPE